MQDLSTQCPMDCSPSSLQLECGPVQPAQALGGRFLGLLKKLMRLIVLSPQKFLEWCQSFTLVTFCTVIFLIAMQMIAMLSFLDIKSVCLSTRGVTEKMQVYRLFTYSHFHSSLPHMILNVIFLSSFSKTIERNLGSFYLFNVVMIFGTSCAVVQMLLEVFISFFYPPVLDDCISGYSGILFGVLILALSVTVNKENVSHNCCGYVPRGLYPLVILLVIQIATREQISIIANLAGIITGYAYKNDLLNFVKLTPNMIFTLEHSELCHIFSTLPGFVPYPRDRLVLEERRQVRTTANKNRTKKDSTAGQPSSCTTAPPKPKENKPPQQSTSPDGNAKAQEQSRTLPAATIV